MLNQQVLLLNNTYEPLNIISTRRALKLIYTNKVEVLESNGQWIRSANLTLRVPIVIRISYYIRRPNFRVKFTKRSVFQRDNFKCQYCGQSDKDITIDHVIPRSSGGLNTWTNVVTACKKCNNSKGNKFLSDSQLILLRQPREPKFLPHLKATRNIQHASWEKYFFVGHNDIVKERS